MKNLNYINLLKSIYGDVERLEKKAKELGVEVIYGN